MINPYICNEDKEKEPSMWKEIQIPQNLVQSKIEDLFEIKKKNDHVDLDADFVIIDPDVKPVNDLASIKGKALV